MQAYLHHRNIMHRDLKSLNVMIDEGGNIKIADFSLSVFTKGKHQEVALVGETGTYRCDALLQPLCEGAIGGDEP